MKKLFSIALCSALLGTSVFAGGHANWASVDAESSIAFGSVKKDVIGEVHSFSAVSGTVSEGGQVEITVDPTSVDTLIDIRNERMIEHVFNKGKAAVTLTGEVDMDEVTGLEVGETTITEFDGVLNLAGVEVDVYADMLVARLGEDRVLVTTADLIMLSTEDLGIDKGIDKLMELASLPGITRAAPVTIRMVFEK